MATDRAVFVLDYPCARRQSVHVCAHWRCFAPSIGKAYARCKQGPCRGPRRVSSAPARSGRRSAMCGLSRRGDTVVLDPSSIIARVTGSTGKRIFTLNEARALLPEVQRLTAEAVGTTETLAARLHDASDAD